MEGLLIEKKDSFVAVVYSGEITLDVTPGMKAEISAATEDVNYKNLIMDLSNVSFIDSSGIGFLVSLNSRVRNAGKTFYLFKPSPQVTKTLDLVQMIKYFKIVNSDEELAALS
ncbi:MAG: STAS domain-containing protein [Thermodesulfobacteriota bacterium]|nr:STAS domain-containing protein [Thermodesulfobacteriota bacterium]